ncbi:MAG: tryptophan 2,3-dioxygenase [Cytophagales bacterium]|nr:MAG: tryptophan 2,3-dioxygenase [Cytophagales bacterium]TAH28715.1 MAG: tryptophan 2,3-dioxygenase [Cytophagales bacterium]
MKNELEPLALTPELLAKLQELRDKYSLTGQDLISNLEGLLYANYLKYWDYIHLDTLLSLQNPRTDFADEKIFITYHQITELYFKLILWELEQIANHSAITTKFYIDRIKRIERYLQNLIFSFDIMVEGMEYEQFRQFRMSLLPSSGFQSAQFRKIEICMTDFAHLLTPENYEKAAFAAPIDDIFDFLYWKQGASDQKTSKETITSIHFQQKYRQDFVELAENYRQKNLWQLFLELDRPKEVIEPLKSIDSLMNIEWRLAHFKSAVKYLKNTKGEATEATGGTNWQKYLPPRFQKIIFYPELWTNQEKENWGKNWVEKVINKNQ